jgi:hypothetical protein
MATRLEWGVGACPTSPPIASGTAGQAEISAKKTVGFRGRHHPGMVGRNYPGMTWASSQKQSPGSCASRGSSCRAEGLGAWSARHSFIGSPTSTAKSSLSSDAATCTRGVIRKRQCAPRPNYALWRTGSLRKSRLLLQPPFTSIFFAAFARAQLKGYGEQPILEAALDFVDINPIRHLKGALK